MTVSYPINVIPGQEPKLHFTCIQCTSITANGILIIKYFIVSLFKLKIKIQLEFVFYVKTDVSPLSMCMSKICKQEL